MAKRGEIPVGRAGESGHSGSPADEGNRFSNEPQEPLAGETATEDKTHPGAGRYGSYEYEPPPRRPRSQRENAFNAVAWLLEGVTGIFEELRHNNLGLSEEFWVHAYAARRESLLALRELVDSTIEHCDREERRRTEQQKRQERRGQVQIE
jgi:sarcosine oxidase delta subunit